jgi:hypothetical protein
VQQTGVAAIAWRGAQHDSLSPDIYRHACPVLNTLTGMTLALTPLAVLLEPFECTKPTPAEHFTA